MEDNFKHKGRRRILASELREKGIQDDRILKAIENIPRHLFIDPGLSEQAYIDKALPIENNQTISQPYTVAFQTQLLNPSASDKILEIGTGSGYQTAVLDYLNLDIYTIERDHALYRSTSNLFNKMKIKPKKFIYGDGFNGMQDHSPSDGIFLGQPEDCSYPQTYPLSHPVRTEQTHLPSSHRHQTNPHCMRVTS